MAIIKTCPFCGGQPWLTIYDMGYGDGRGYPGKHKIEIRCAYSFCGVKPSVSVDDIYIKILIKFSDEKRIKPIGVQPYLIKINVKIQIIL